jgi:long-chain fatty acid transport protein
LIQPRLGDGVARGAALVGLVGALALAPGSASAGGYSLATRGVRSFSVGGANVAGADGLDAFWMNPANLGDTQLAVDAGLLLFSATYTPPDGGASVSNESPPVPVPSLGFTWRVTDRLSLGLAAYAPWGATVAFPATGAQRYQLVQSTGSFGLTVALGAALRLGDLRLGAAFTNTLLRVKQRLVLSAYTGLFGFAEDPSLDVLAEIDLDDPLNLGGTFGIGYTLGPVELGAMVQLPFEAGGDASFRQNKPSSVFFDPVEIKGDTARISVPFPVMARAGLGWRITDAVRVEAAFGFEDWSTQQRLVVEPTNFELIGVPAIGTYSVGPAVLDRRMQDTFSVHLGGSWRVHSRVELRTGGFWERSSFTDATFSLALPDDDKLALALGASVRFGDFRLDAAFGPVLQGTRVVTTSALRQNNATNPAQAAIVGNGTYETGYWVGGLGFAWTPARAEAKRLEDARPTLDTSIEEDLAR